MAGPVTPPPGPAAAASRADAIRDVERWFVRRGVPQLIEGYTSEPAMDARAAPFIAAWLVIGTILHWGTRSDWLLHQNAIGIVATLGWMTVSGSRSSAFAAARSGGGPGGSTAATSS